MDYNNHSDHDLWSKNETADDILNEISLELERPASADFNVDSIIDEIFGEDFSRNEKKKSVSDVSSNVQREPEKVGSVAVRERETERRIEQKFGINIGELGVKTPPTAPSGGFSINPEAAQKIVSSSGKKFETKAFEPLKETEKPAEKKPEPPVNEEMKKLEEKPQRHTPDHLITADEVHNLHTQGAGHTRTGLESANQFFESLKKKSPKTAPQPEVLFGDPENAAKMSAAESTAPRTAPDENIDLSEWMSQKERAAYTQKEQDGQPIKGQITLDEYVPKAQKNPAPEIDDNTKKELAEYELDVNVTSYSQNEKMPEPVSTVDMRVKPAPHEELSKELPPDVDGEDDEIKTDFINDYKGIQDVRAVCIDLRDRRHREKRDFNFTFAIELVLILLAVANTTASQFFSQMTNPTIFLAAELIFLLTAAFINFSSVFGGIASIFKFKPNLDSPVAVAVLACAVQNIIMLFMPSGAKNSGVYIYNCAAVFAILAAGIGKRIKLRRIRKNFDLIGNDRKKVTCHTCPNENDAFEISRGVSIGDPLVSFGRKVCDAQGFLTSSYSVDPVESSAAKASPFILLAAIIFSVLFAYFTPNIGFNIPVMLSAFCSVVCVSVPCASLLAGNGIIYRFCRRLRNRKIVVSGYDSVDKLSDVNVIAVDAPSLFPKGYVRLHDIKNPNGAPVADAILAAASITKKAGGPLSDLFGGMIQDERTVLPKVKSLVYEDKAGLSGIVGDKRVLLGNRRLLLTHRIPAPDEGSEAIYLECGCQMVYLAENGRLTAVFVVSYHPNRYIRNELRNAVKRGLGFSVYTCDPNINSELLSRLFGISENSIKTMNSAARGAYKRSVASQEDTRGLVTHNGSAGAFASAVVSAMRIHRQMAWAKALQMIFTILILLGIAALEFTSGAALNPLKVLGIQFAATLATCVIPWFTGR